MQEKNSIRAEILSDLEIFSRDDTLYHEKNFCLRAHAIDDLEFKIIDRIDAIMEDRDVLDKMTDLKELAEKTKRDLEVADVKMFQRLRIKISLGEYRGTNLLKLLDEYQDNNLSGFLQQDTIGYDQLDIFVNGLLLYQNIPAETKWREPEMVFYQKTPVRIILELIKRVEFQSQDVFVDLGSGLGQAVMLVNLITSVQSIGVEFEPAFCTYARALATELGLQGVEFISGDARFADYSEGTVFFMYSPFEGEMLREILQILMKKAKKSKIRIFTYGPCTAIVAQQNWLLRVNETQREYSGLGEFKSL
jgi:Histone methylation protein DOT1